MVIGKLDSHIQKNETRAQSHTIQKINSKWIKDLNVRPKAIKFLKKSDNLTDIGLSDVFVDQTP